MLQCTVMGIPIDPPPDIGADSFCWPPGKTPAILLLSVSGMTRGDWMPWWVDWDGPNGVWELERIGANNWGLSGADFEFDFLSHKPGSQLLVAIPGVEFSFIGWDPRSCIFTFDNDAGGIPPFLWYGGRAQITWK